MKSVLTGIKKFLFGSVCPEVEQGEKKKTFNVGNQLLPRTPFTFMNCATYCGFSIKKQQTQLLKLVLRVDVPVITVFIYILITRYYRMRKTTGNLKRNVDNKDK